MLIDLCCPFPRYCCWREVIDLVDIFYNFSSLEDYERSWF